MKLNKNGFNIDHRIKDIDTLIKAIGGELHG
jgi:hypothetical protein